MFEPNFLLDYWNSLVERCGVILEDGKIVELVNSHQAPDQGFAFPPSTFEENPTAVATWHTHPDGNPNLSVPDYHSFLTKPTLFHYIAGDGKVWGFYIQEDKVLRYEDDCF